MANSLFVKLLEVREWLIKLFFFAFLVLGTIFVFALPPFQAPDESTHWRAAVSRIKAVTVKKGERICSKALSLPDYLISASVSFHYSNKVPTGRYQRIKRMKESCIDQQVVYGNVGTYFMVALASLIVDRYDSVPRQALIAFFLSRWIGGLCLALILLRFYVVSRRLYGFAVPGTLPGAVFLASPLFVQQSFAVSADVVVNIMAVALATVFISAKRPGYLDLGLAFIFAIIVAATKPVMAPFMLFLPLAGLLLIGGCKKVADQEADSIRRLLVILLAVSTALACCIFFLGSVGIDSLSSSYISGIDASRQLEYSLANPVQVGLMLFWKIVSLFNVYWLTGPLGWLDTPVSRWVINSWMLLLLTAAVMEVVFLFSCRYGQKKTAILVDGVESRKMLLLSDFFGVVFFLSAMIPSMLLIVFALYLAWTPVGEAGVLGVQSRYFLPFFIVAPLILAVFVRPCHFQADSSGLNQCKKVSLTSLVTLILVTLGIMMYSCHVYVDLARRFY